MGTHPIFESDFDCLTDVDYDKIKREIMKFVLKQNNDKMLNVYRNWCQAHLGRKIENLEIECSRIEFLLEIIKKSTGIRCHERIKGQSQSQDIELILEELNRNQCQTSDITPKGLLSGELDSVLTLFYNLTRKEQDNKNESKKSTSNSNQQMDQDAIKKIIPPPPFPSKSNRSMSRLPTSGGQRSIPKPASRIVLNRAASTAGSTAGTGTVTQPESSKLNRYALKEKQTDSDIKSDARNPKNERMSGLKPPSGHSRSILSPGGTGQDRVRGRGLNENKTTHTRSDSASSKESS